jgi:antitoxin (DNA-binding transcriptional repressor) of toxin-antitoxin stability system
MQYDSMIQRASVTDVIRNFSDYINRVVYRGERFLLVRGGAPVAELSPLPAGRRLAELPGLLDALPRLDPGDAAALEADLDRARSKLDARAPGDPWES